MVQHFLSISPATVPARLHGSHCVLFLHSKAKLLPKKTIALNLGVSLQLAKQHFCMLSNIPNKTSCFTVLPGIIDADFRGILKVIVRGSNVTRPVYLTKGHPMCQATILRYYKAKNDLYRAKERDTRKFGSS